jgi:cytochrome P450
MSEETFEALMRDPLPELARLRREDPVHWDDRLQGWLVTRHADVKRLLVDPRLTRDRRLGPHYVSPPEGSWAWRFANESVASLGAEEHMRWRSRVSAGFTPRAVRRMEGQVREVVEQFAEPIRGRRDTVDLVAAFTDPIPNTVISRITGIPPYPGEEERFRRLAQDVLRPFFPMVDEANRQRGEAAIGELAEWVHKLAEERRREPREDLVSDLIHGNRGGEVPTNDEIVFMLTAMVAAGSETTTQGGTWMLLLLLEHPDQLTRLRADPSLVAGAVRESLRFGFGQPAGEMPRFALEDFELHGRRIRKGEMLMFSTMSTSRDESVWSEPDRFDITRDTREMLTFGHGAHYCLGANLALQEMRCMLECALEFLPETATVDAAAIEWERIGLLRRPISLPVDLGSRSAGATRT